MTKILIVLMAAMLTACGGGGSDEELDAQGKPVPRVTCQACVQGGLLQGGSDAR